MQQYQRQPLLRLRLPPLSTQRLALLPAEAVHRGQLLKLLLQGRQLQGRQLQGPGRFRPQWIQRVQRLRQQAPVLAEIAGFARTSARRDQWLRLQLTPPAQRQRREPRSPRVAADSR
jgi:hypothetical protein